VTTIATEIGEIVTLYDSLHKTPKSYQNEGYSMIRVTDIKRGFVSLDGTRKVDAGTYNEFSKKHKPQIGDILFSRVGSYGNSCFLNKKIDICLGQNTVCISPDSEKVDPFYLYSFFNSPDSKSQVDSFVGGSSQPTISLANIKKIKITLPTLKVQKKVSQVIATYDNLIENNSRRIAILEDMAQSLYREWFVKFRFPGYQNCKFKESSLGLIPEGWEVERLDDFVVLQRGFDLPKKKRNEEGDIPIYASSGICGYHDEVKVKGPGIVTGRSGTLGIVILILEDFWALNTTLWVKEFKNCSAFYGYYLLSSIGLENYNSGAAVPTLNRNYIHGLPIISPPKNLIDKFEKYTGSNFKEIDLLKRKNKVLQSQRDMLLPKLISGSIQLYGS